MTEGYERHGVVVFGNRLGFGVRPALVLIDFMKGYVLEGSPFYAPGVVTALSESLELLAAGRAARIPIFHTIVRYNPVSYLDGGLWVRKIPALRHFVDDDPYAQTCDGVSPMPGEVVITKQYASAFYGTSFAAMLAAQSIDTVILAGCSTSGCVRASAVDAVQHGFRAMVVRDCVGDRLPDVHEASLFDIDSKYGDVVAKSETIQYLQGLNSDLFDMHT